MTFDTNDIRCIPLQTKSQNNLQISNATKIFTSFFFTSSITNILVEKFDN